jgi:hypothetical protein
LFLDRKGLAASLGLTVAHILTTCLLLWVIKLANDKKAKLRTELSPEELLQPNDSIMGYCWKIAILILTTGIKEVPTALRHLGIRKYSPE